MPLLGKTYWALKRHKATPFLLRAYFAFGVVALFTVFAASAGAYTYIVKRGNSLSKIAAELIPGPVWGARGSLNALIAKNPTIRNPDLIFPGDKIEIDTNATTAQLLVAGLQRSPASDAVRVDPADVVTPTVTNDSIDFIKIGSWGLEADYSSSKIHSLDKNSNTSADILSNHNLGLAFFWTQDWNEDLKTTLTLELRRWNLDPPSIATLTAQNPLLYKFSSKAQWRASNRISLTGGFAYDQDINLTNTNPSIIGVDTVRIPKLKIGADYDILRTGEYVLGFSSAAQTLFPGTASGYTTKLGYAFNVGTYIVLPLKTKAIKATIHYDEKTIGTARTQQTESNIIFGIGWSFPVTVRKNEAKNGEATYFDY